MQLSIVIPTFNEVAVLPATLRALAPLRDSGVEVVVVDGGSDDATACLAQGGTELVIASARGRARQLNAGAHSAHGDALLFLHADTQLPAGGAGAVLAALESTAWGRFDVRLSGSHPLLRIVETGMNWRSRITGIATGDQAMFMRRAAFETVGGFPEIALMEDVAMSAQLRAAFGPPACLIARVVTSSRRWEQGGIVRTVLKMWRLRLAYALGVSPEQLHRDYYSQP